MPIRILIQSIYKGIMMKINLKKIISAIGILSLSSFATAATLKVDSGLPEYKKVSGVSGTLNSIGSDTLNNLMTYWSESFRSIYPNVKIQIEGKGSSTAPPALIVGTSQLGPMSRKMKTIEIEKFEKKYGFEPTAIGVALDSLAVYIHKDNPLNEISLQEVDSIFSKTKRGGLTEDIIKWGQLSLKDSWGNKKISLYGRNSASGTYGYFKKKALFKGDFKNTVKEQPGSASVVLGISKDLGGIGYSGIGYKTSSVKALSLSKKKGEKTYAPNYENVLKGKYPLGRMLYVYIVKKPNIEADKLTKEFLKFVLSKKGQEIVVKDGYLPLTAGISKKQISLLK
jgi:phosphate transport system substrate-binding protein